MKTKTEKRKCANEKTNNVCNRRPRVTLIRLSNGRIRIVNSSAAAKFAGVSHQAFGRVVRRSVLPPENPKSVYRKIEGKVKAAYPELFDNPTIIDC